MLVASVAEIDDVDVLIAATLHDVLEDTPTTAAEVEQLFGARVCRFVQALSILIPREAVHRLSPGLEALSWVPGISTVAALPGVERMLSKATVLTAPEPAIRSELHRLEETVEKLQSDVAQLQEQVAFLENLLQQRGGESYLTGTSGRSS